MADEVIGTVKDTIKGIFENVSAPKNESAPVEKKPSTPEGMAVAYGSLVVMAMLPIIFGSIRSVKLHKLKKVSVQVGACIQLQTLTRLSFPSADSRRARRPIP